MVVYCSGFCDCSVLLACYCTGFCFDYKITYRGEDGKREETGLDVVPVERKVLKSDLMFSAAHRLSQQLKRDIVIISVAEL